MKFWLMKSEPESYSIDQLAKDRETLWEGVRNYQARNFMQKEMEKGDQILFYHSNASPSAVVGLMEVSGDAVPDPSATSTKSLFFDPKSTKEKPIWYCVKVKFKKKFKNSLSLKGLKKEKTLKNMVLLQKGSRLSVQPVTKGEFETICKLADK
ncbi:MAG: EVE domain-containing protein [Bdellovibrionales bacterium]